MEDYPDSDIQGDMGLVLRASELARPHAERTVNLFKDLGQFALGALDGLRQHPVVSTEIGGLSFAGGIAIGSVLFSRRR